ncbi:NlpC/P60 family protein [Cryptosporangium aurantiacum]|uniref:NlpC/P60 family protein n=2 Tax=Cryptosporangium aurantiacum TaxID=134849 RepID=A0A1M7REJ4_9ACTN|nr:NlpC/P60 family protein [Cryptosporangium aurantiacum]
MSNEHTAAADQLGEAARALVTARADVDRWTRNSYIDAARRPAGLATDPRNRMFGQQAPAAGAPLANLRAAEATHRAATDELTRAATAALRQQQRVLELATDLDQRGKALQQLRKAHQPTLVAARRQQEVTDAASAARYLRDADGRAGKAAVKAVEFALAQRGKPYEWGAEGPDRYDCSGLVQTAYAHAGIRLPRTARPQYRATPRVSITALLPGDLLFFATDKSDWNTIHHVALYLGQGRMLHAPTTGDVVRIAPVWWAEFYAATRVVPAATPPATTPRATPRATPKATPTRTPTPTPTRTPSASPVPTTPPPSTPTPSATSPGPTTPPAATPPPSPTPTSAAPDPTPSATPPPVIPTNQPSATP